MSESVKVGDLSFTLHRSAKRKSVGITVERDGKLTLTAPANCPLALIEQVAQEKQFWVYTKLAQKQLLFQPAPQKEFVTGEGFYYLGRSYRLLLVSESDESLPPLRLHQGRFRLKRSEREHALNHFQDWYIAHGLPWLQRRVELFADRIGVTPQGVEVRDLGYRWGSCGQSGNLNFHWRTILLPPRIIEYVVVHELVHLHEPHHDTQFWKRLERAMPDYATRKQWLAENGSRFT